MTYTPEGRKNAHEALDLVLDGKTGEVEQCHHSYTRGRWEPLGFGGFQVNKSGWLYRPKPAPSVIPWTRETCPPLPFEVVSKPSKNRYAVIEVQESGVYIGTAKFFTFEQLFVNFTRPDGSPCGEVRK